MYVIVRMLYVCSWSIVYIIMLINLRRDHYSLPPTYKFQFNEETYLYIHYVLVIMCQIHIHGKCTTHLHLND